MGLRELKKEQTRQLIANAAWQLFADRGFENVSVAQIAREAQVAEATVFNYFQSKEDLFYSRLEAFGTELAQVVAGRPAGETALTAFRRALLAGGGQLELAACGDTDALARLRTISRVIADSPALLAREQQAMAHNTEALAAVLAADTGATQADPRPLVAANALMGVHRAVVGHVRRGLLAGEDAARLAADVRTLATAAFTLLEDGLAGYAARQASQQGHADGQPR